MRERGTEAPAMRIQQRVELLAVVSSFGDAASAVRGAVERTAQAVEAEVAAVVFGDRVAAAIGFPADQVPEADLVAVAQRRLDRLEGPGLRSCPGTAARRGRRPPRRPGPGPRGGGGLSGRGGQPGGGPGRGPWPGP